MTTLTRCPSKRARRRARFRAHRARVRGQSRERPIPAAQANGPVFYLSESCFVKRSSSYGPVWSHFRTNWRFFGLGSDDGLREMDRKCDQTGDTDK